MAYVRTARLGGEAREMLTLIAALLTSILLCGLRLDVARVVGLGDAEALFVAYGFHPQPAYVGHPGLIGWIARGFGPEPAPRTLHFFTALAATALPWVGVLAARACGASGRAALRAYFPLALIPAFSIGSFAFSPDLPLCFFWLCTLGCAGWALRQPVLSFGALLASVGVGAGAALCCLSKLSGWLLALSLLAACIGRFAAPRWRTLAPWAACGLFGILTAPLVTWWLTRGLSLQLDPELSWQHASMTLLRPLVTVTPPFLYAGVVLIRDLTSRARQAPMDRLLRLSLLAPLVPLLLLGVCTTTETDWLTPAYLALSLHATLAPPLRKGLVRSCFGLGMAVALLGWAWLRTDLPFATGRLLGGYDPSLDSSNDLYAWGPGKTLLETAVMTAHERTGRTPIVVGPHWAVCAQAEVALGRHFHVGCDSVEVDDYDDWSDPALWADVQTILFVTDTRFHRAPPETFYGRPALAVHHVNVERFGQTVRGISVTEFDRDESTARRSAVEAAGAKRAWTPAPTALPDQ